MTQTTLALGLQDLTFKDIYLGKSRVLLTGVPGSKDPVPAPDSAKEELDKLRALCEEVREKTGRDEFPVRSGDIAYRASIMEALTDTVFVLRRMPDTIPRPDQLCIHPGYIEMLTRPEMTGLVVIAGPYGQGKTTTASSILAARLAKFGGVGITIEDPPEMPLEGDHGNGVCFQTQAVRGTFGEACHRADRWTPSMILIGEIRQPEAAAEALRASINGRLVLCTVHAESVSMAIERIYALSVNAIGNPEDAAALLGNGLLAVLHQRLEGEPRKPKVEFLWLGDADAVGVRNIIRQRKFDQVGNEVKAQLNRMVVRRPSDVGAMARG